MKKNYFLLFLLSMTSVSMYAQSPTKVVDDYLNQAQRKGEFKEQISYNVINENVIGNNVGDYVKIQQTINGIPVYGSTATFQIQNGKVISSNQTFYNETVNASLAVTPKLDASGAVAKMAQFLGKSYTAFENIESIEAVAKNSKIDTSKNNVSFLKDSPSYLYYYNDKGTLKLAWYLLTEIKDEDTDVTKLGHLYETIVDANTGELLRKNSIVNNCYFHAEGKSNNVYHNNPADYTWVTEAFANNNVVHTADTTTADAPLNATYKVIPANFTSPLEHDFTLLTNTYDPVASKEGWHKLLPSAAAKNPTLTKYHTVGNNIQVGYDKDGKFSELVFGLSTFLLKSADSYIKNEAYGGEKLLFDFPTPGKSTNYNVFDYTEAATTQMFYSMNTIHDVLHYHGFNPKAGSFQMNEGDKRRVFGFSTSGQGTLSKVENNAVMAYNSFVAPNPVTMFFIFKTLEDGAGALEIKDGDLKGIYGGAVGNNAGFKYGETPSILGELVFANDNAGGDAHDVCEPIVNGKELEGKIVVINRGTCSFIDKITNVDQYKPAGVLVLNKLDANISGIFNVGNNDIAYPITMVNKPIADKIKAKLASNIKLEGYIPSSNFKLKSRDSDFDSQVLLHEYTHAVSNRITNGAIGGEEGMGEGWSDYVAINLTQQPGQAAKDQINMGSYAFGGAGLRILPYTTDMSVNPHTYDYLKTIGAGENLQHPTGYVWALMLWEMHWKLIEEYGFNPDFKSSTGGNNMALDLVIQGIKMQVDNPGFVDGRDAILDADVALYKGANQCLIWEAFAKRGLGYSAKQGNPLLRADGTEAYDLPADCKKLGTDDVKAETLNIYPNPVKDLVYISTKDEVKQYEIIDVTGRVISSGVLKTENNVKSVSTAHLSSGLYILKLHTDKGVVTKKIIKK
ncbi:M36 family metallopeptidase [Algoriella sp.]|uniref:M36 family metallopeptidase n=1 Tax=Algoriella sp. TaxID=1872434 RepID=UPI00257EC55B|nr:M36 family metallopeptidase [Algoriella sp.]